MSSAQKLDMLSCSTFIHRLAGHQF